MDDKPKYIGNDLSELNFRLSSLYEFIKIKEITNAADLKQLEQIIASLKSANDISEGQKKLLPEISELISTLKYDLSELKNKIIKSDDELKQDIYNYDVILNYGNYSIREKDELKRKKDNYVNELNKYVIKPSMGYGYMGKLNVNSIPYESVNIGMQYVSEFEKVDSLQKNLVNSMQTGFKAAGNVLSSAIADSIIPLNKVNSLTQVLLKTFIEASTKALLMKTIFSGVDNLFSAGFGFGSFTNPLSFNDILPVNNNSFVAYNSVDNYKHVNYALKYPENNEIVVKIPQVEFKQKGYDLTAVIKKVSSNNSRYL